MDWQGALPLVCRSRRALEGGDPPSPRSWHRLCQNRWRKRGAESGRVSQSIRLSGWNQARREVKRASGETCK
eukprot:10396420-Prorocentrum_lima.AAC.1